VNLMFITPRVKGDGGRVTGDGSATRPASPVTVFRGIVISEVFLGLVLLLSVGVFTSLPPAQITSAPPAFTAEGQAEDVHGQISIMPGKVGINVFTVTLTANGQPVLNAKEVALRFTPAQGNVPPSEATLTEQGNGQYSITGAYLSLPDQWQVQLVARRENKFDAFINYTLDLSPTAATTIPWGKITGLLIAFAAVIFGFTSLHLKRPQWAAAGLVPALILLTAGATVFARPTPTPKTSAINPIAFSPESVARGAEIYIANCLPCHGVGGKGDGPVGLTLNPRPADLTQHAIPGVHTDGQLFDWVSNGYPGTVMPAFKESLTEEERWYIVNFIRSLAPKTTP
jgi:mono/diheme cytochrome c family protein